MRDVPFKSLGETVSISVVLQPDSVAQEAGSRCSAANRNR